MAKSRTYGVVDVADNSTTVLDGPCKVYGIYVNTNLSANALPIKDGSTTVATLPASAGAGDFFDLFGVTFENSLVVDPDDAATGNISVIYEALDKS